MNKGNSIEKLVLIVFVHVYCVVDSSMVTLLSDIIFLLKKNLLKVDKMIYLKDGNLLNLFTSLK